MKKLSTLKTMLAAALLAVGVGNVWADEQPTPVYFNDFSSTDGLTVVGNGVFEDDADARFGKVFHNDPTLTKAIRTNWLELPADIFSHSTETKEMTIGFWVNKKTAVDYYYSPLFTAYGADNVNKSHSWSEDNANGWWPFLYLEARGIMQWNAGGWCDFTDSQNDAGTNIQSTVWTDDGNWHYVTMTFTTSTAKVFVDGNVHNSWTIADNGLAGLFTQTDLKHFCLGGNQAFGWDDPDPAFAFDDFAVYDKALTAEQIKAVMAKKLVYTFDFENNPQNLPVGEGADFQDGALKAPIVVNGVTLTSVQGDAVYPAIMMKDNSGVIALNVYMNGAFKLNAPEGKAVVKVVATMKSKLFSLMTPSTGTTTENTWEGNATEVTYSASALMSFLKLEVTLADENSETVKPEAPAYDVEVANIAAFRAAEDGKVVKLTLTNAQVNAIDDIFNFAYVEDATGAVEISGVTLTANTLLNGYVIGTKSSATLDYSNPDAGLEIKLAATDDKTFTATEATLTAKAVEVAAIASAENHGRLMVISNVEIKKEGRFYYAYNGEDKVQVKDAFMVLPTDYEWPEKAKSITGLITFNGARYQIAPLKVGDIVADNAQPTSVTFDFSNENLHKIGTDISDKDGWFINETFTIDNVLLQVVGGSAPSRIFTETNGVVLNLYNQYGTLTFNAPEGFAITKIEFTNVNADNQFSFTASSGAFTGKTWEGNAEGVRMVNEKSPRITKIVVTLAAKNDATVALAPINYVECENIAAFNALEAGTYAKVTLTDAELTGISADGYSTMWIQDASAGCWIQYLSLMNKYLEPNNKVNGFFYVVKRVASGNPQMKEAEDTPESEFTQTPFGEPTMIEGTLAEVNVEANLNKVVKIKDATLTMTVTTNKNTGAVTANGGTLTQGGATIDVSNGTETANQQLHKISDWEDGKTLENITIVAILVAKSATANQLLPISITSNASGIETIHNSQFTVKNSIYNLQGIRLNSLQKGLNIVNGKKVVMK